MGNWYEFFLYYIVILFTKLSYVVPIDVSFAFC